MLCARLFLVLAESLSDLKCRVDGLLPEQAQCTRVRALCVCVVNVSMRRSALSLSLDLPPPPYVHTWLRVSKREDALESCVHISPSICRSRAKARSARSPLPSVLNSHVCKQQTQCGCETGHDASERKSKHKLHSHTATQAHSHTSTTTQTLRCFCTSKNVPSNPQPRT